MHVTRVKAQNIMGIEFAEILPSATTTVIGGKNGAGKSSLLNAMSFALGGKRMIPERPLRDGANYGQVEVDLDGDQEHMIPECVVTRTFVRSAENPDDIESELEIRSKDGYVAPSPQSILDMACSKVGFDPLAFSRMTPAEQVALLKSLVGLDFTKDDELRARLYSERTIVNRDGKAKKAVADKLPRFEGVPFAEVSLSDLSTELSRRMKVNEANAKEVARVVTADEVIARDAQHVEACRATVERLRSELSAAEKRLTEASENMDKHSVARDELIEKVGKLVDENVEEIQQKVKESEDINRKVRANHEAQKADKELEALRARSKELSDKIEAIDKKKSEAMKNAPWPIEGLSFSESGVTWMGRPFEQASSAEQLTTGIAIGAAMNPTLKMLIIRDGSLLDEDSLIKAATYAAERGCQLFVERVGVDNVCNLTISAGKVASADEGFVPPHKEVSDVGVESKEE